MKVKLKRDAERREQTTNTQETKCLVTQKYQVCFDVKRIARQHSQASL
jgi:hypothetical protein